MSIISLSNLDNLLVSWSNTFHIRPKWTKGQILNASSDLVVIISQYISSWIIVRYRISYDACMEFKWLQIVTFIPNTLFKTLYPLYQWFIFNTAAGTTVFAVRYCSSLFCVWYSTKSKVTDKNSKSIFSLENTSYFESIIVFAFFTNDLYSKYTLPIS